MKTFKAGAVLIIGVIFTIAFMGVAMAQAQERIAAFGGGIDQNGESFGWGAASFNSPLTPEGFQQYAGFDIYAADKAPMDLEGGSAITIAGKELVYSAYLGLYKKVFTAGRLTVGALVAPGIITNGDFSEFLAKYGGFIHYSVTNKFGLVLGPEGTYNRIDKDDFNLKFGATVKF